MLRRCCASAHALIHCCLVRQRKQILRLLQVGLAWSSCCLYEQRIVLQRAAIDNPAGWLGLP